MPVKAAGVSKAWLAQDLQKPVECVDGPVAEFDDTSPLFDATMIAKIQWAHFILSKDDIVDLSFEDYDPDG